MCLIISVLLAALSFNFYVNGFFIQAFISGLFSIGLMIFMIRSIDCKNGSCAPRFKKEDKDDN